jgi:nitroreductase
MFQKLIDGFPNVQHLSPLIDPEKSLQQSISFYQNMNQRRSVREFSDRMVDQSVITPCPMNFLTKVLNRPENETPFLLLPVGYPSDDCWVPDLRRKTLEEVSVWYQ